VFLTTEIYLIRVVIGWVLIKYNDHKMKKIIVTESNLLNIIDKLITEEIVKNEKLIFSAILGYIDTHWNKISENFFPDKMKGLMIKKEVMIFCENKRDNKLTKELSKESIPFFNTVKKMVESSQNIMDYSNIGKNIKHT
jgi:metal-dependent HD superfamily phosphatase/phosphodiesterase